MNKVRKLIKHPLISGSSVVFVGWFLANFINYIFNLAMGRLLSVADYGLLISLSSLFVLSGIFSSTFSSTFAKFAATHHANSNKEGFKNIIIHGSKLTIGFSLVLFIVLVLADGFFLSFLHVNNSFFLFLIYGAICFNVLFSLPFGIFQGQMRFYLLSSINGIQAILKLIFGIALVVIGMKVLGALIGIFLAISIPTTVIFFVLLKPYVKEIKLSLFHERKITKELTRYGGSFFMSTIGISLLSSTDIILVRHFFDATVSGQYAALSLMGKAIYYLIGPVGFVFFPLIAYRKEKNESTTSLLLLTIGIVSFFSLALSFVYFVFPNLVLSIFFPSAPYRLLTSYLGIFSMYIFVFSLASLFNSFFLSMGKTSVYKVTLSVGILQTVLIFIFHTSLYQIIAILFSSSFLMLAILLVFYLKDVNVVEIIKTKRQFSFSKKKSKIG